MSYPSCALRVIHPGDFFDLPTEHNNMIIIIIIAKVLRVITLFYNSW